eukprot:6492372-Amphidinium_carterae.1
MQESRGQLEAGSHVDEPSVWDCFPEYYSEVYDNISGKLLDPSLVAKGRAEEMEFLRNLGAWQYDSVDACMNATGKPPVSVGWVDVNKGDAASPAVRCRLVVKETKWRSTISDPSQTWSATPPYEALRFLASLCMSPGSGEHDFVLQFIDITRAHPHCLMRRDLWIQLPAEDPESKVPGRCAKLLRSLYGTRDAGQNFELLVHETLTEKMGFEPGIWSPCIYKCPERSLMTFVYGDNFVTRGSRTGLEWFLLELRKHMWAKLEGVLGPREDLGDSSELLCLNRIFRWCKQSADGPEAIEIEGDPRHQEIICHHCNLGAGRAANAVSTPGVRDNTGELGKELETSAATMFRSLCMRANYLSSDRPDISFSAKEAARHMSKPCELGESAAKRLARFLNGRPRCVQRMEKQSPQQHLHIYSDSDHAGCTRTRKSTSCSVVMHGGHMLRFTVATQQPIALSSAESEWYALVRAATVGIGMVSMCLDYGVSLKPILYSDATAASGIGARRGAGKVRHIETSTLWLQRHLTSGVVTLKRQEGPSNIADLGTKHVDGPTMLRHMKAM